MRVLTILGTRPEIIRLSRIIPRLDETCRHTLLFTGQNAEPRLSTIFFDELGVRSPDVRLEVGGSSFAEQVSRLFAGVGAALATHQPDRVVVLGDTNSGLAAVVAARARIPVFHLEAGNRCYDDRSPEEVNRRVIDHASTVLMPYTHRSKDNLVREGIDRDRIFVTGNPIFEVLEHSSSRIGASRALAESQVKPGAYFLMTLHRAETVDDVSRLGASLDAAARASAEFGVPTLFPVHPRTHDRLSRAGLSPSGGAVRLIPPLGFFDFVALERQAKAVLSDSGTVQEECAILKVPNVIMRESTERAETIECGASILGGTDPEGVVRSLGVVLSRKSDMQSPPEYTVPHVSEIATQIILGRVPPIKTPGGFSRPA
jgi:UDP-N-acetylglucosamine 2-epimerase (non-hydrolysing)